ncbi:MAG TPA: hypothetical protein VGV17_15235 [Bosea sp. (in: a-proteobacteria)]|jgi:hypothetical protein|uniref:hypothetical protein n=1 Tax=Bosea sp. (in: a-proteobacteria) TaxID=1871050 RepID=UPI002DDD456A|nr:hypothetical protein [Bosea sp. (in: a-proteobacteria)]HEV2555107.1 hypothetical protein [Bosea sp. (in: a-proteobacteria)]
MLRGCVLASLLLLAPGAEAAGPFGKIVVGNWTGGAYTNDATGAFSHCAVNAGYRNGTRMFTSITADFKWLIGFAHPNWKLKPGSSLNLQLVFDRTSRIDVRAEARSPTLLAIAMPADSQLIGAFRQGHRLELVANDQRLTFALTSTREMLPALVECARQSASLRGPVNPAARANPTAPQTEAERQDRAEKRAVLEKTRDLIRARMLTCIGREGGPMLATDEKAEVVAKAAMIFCKADVDALAQAIIEIREHDGARPVDREAVRRAATQSVQDVVVAQIVKSRGEMLNRRNQQPATPSRSGEKAI